jgi:hypothetical protein
MKYWRNWNGGVVSRFGMLEQSEVITRAVFSGVKQVVLLNGSDWDGEELVYVVWDLRFSRRRMWRLTVFWNVSPCSFADWLRLFGESCCLHHHHRWRQQILPHWDFYRRTHFTKDLLQIRTVFYIIIIIININLRLHYSLPITDEFDPREM